MAYSISPAFAAVFAATDNFNPAGSGCFIAKAPLGCESNPDVACERGKDVKIIAFLLQASMVFLYFVYCPGVIISMQCQVNKLQSEVNESTGLHKIKESARKNMLQSVTKQMAIYLFSFWFTWIFLLSHVIYRSVTGRILYNFVIFANCIYRLQGFVFASVYFLLDRVSKVRVSLSAEKQSNTGGHLTVEDIRESARISSERCESEVEESHEDSKGHRRIAFNIFDGEPDEDSPWAQFFEEENDDGLEEGSK